MQPERNTIRRALGLLAESSARETAISIIILIIRALLPLLAVLLLRYFVDQVTGAAGSGMAEGTASEAFSAAPGMETVSGIAGLRLLPEPGISHWAEPEVSNWAEPEVSPGAATEISPGAAGCRQSSYGS